MTTMVDPLVAFARKHPEMFAADQRARMTRVLNTPGLEKADVVNQDLVKAEAKIARRKDVNPKRGIAEYGKVKFADPVNKKYPLDNEEHVRAAWSYINMPKNAAKYQPGAVALMKRRIMAAAKQYGIAIDAPTAKSAADAELVKAQKNGVSHAKRRLIDSPMVGDRFSHPEYGIGELSVGAVENKPFHVKYDSGKEFDFGEREYREHLGMHGIKGLPVNEAAHVAGVKENERRAAQLKKEYESGEYRRKAIAYQNAHRYDDPAEKSEEPATEIIEETNELALASARFAKSGPCVGDQYEIVPRQGFSLLKSRGTITEVLPNGMVGLEVTNHLGVTKQEYVHRVELTTQMTQGRIALTKSGGSADDENVTGKMCAKCGEHPVSTDLPLSGYCDECLTVPRHWW